MVKFVPFFFVFCVIVLSMKLECYLRAIGLVYGLIELVYSLPLFFLFLSPCGVWLQKKLIAI